MGENRAPVRFFNLRNHAISREYGVGACEIEEEFRRDPSPWLPV